MVNAAWRRLYLVAVVVCLPIAGCSGPTADQSVAAARQSLARQDYGAAAIELKTALQAAPDHAEARFLLGQTLLATNDPAGAEVELRRAADLKFPPDQLLPVLAQALLQLPDGLGKAIALDSQFEMSTPQAVAVFKTTLSEAYAQQGRMDLATAALDAALAAKPDHVPARLAQARRLAAGSDVPGAAAIVDQVLKQSPADADALTLKGNLLQFTRGDAEGASQLYRQALGVSASHLPANTSLLNLLFDQGKIDDAQAQVEKLAKLRPSHPVTLLFRARLALARGQPAACDELIQSALKTGSSNVQLLQFAGGRALQRGELLQAEQLLSAHVRLLPESISGRELLAQVHLSRNDPEKALLALEPLLNGSRADGRALALAGVAQVMSGQLKVAEEHFRRALKADPTDVSTRIALATTRLGGSGAAAAMAELETVAAGDPSGQADMALFTAQVNRNQFDAAIKSIERLDKKQPGKPLPHHLRALVLVHRNDLAAARASYDKALAIDPTFFPALDGVLSLDARERRLDAGRKRLETLIASHPGDSRTLAALARVEDLMGMPRQQVAETYAKAIAAKPGDATLRSRLIGYHLEHKDPNAAIDAANQALAALPGQPEIIQLLATAQLAGGDPHQAASSFSKVVSMRPRSVSALVGLANAHAAAKSFNSAAEALRRAAAIAPDSAEVLTAALRIDVVAGQIDASVARAKALQQRHPKAAGGFAMEGEAELARRNWPAAAAAFKAALQRSPDAADLAQRLHAVYRAAGDSAKADSWAEEWARTHPTDPSFPFYMARNLIADRKFEQAESQLARVLKLDPDHPMALNNLAWIQSEQKKPQALETAERAHRLAPNQPAILDTLAKVVAERGDDKRAVKLQAAAVDLDPSAHDMRLQLARLCVRAGYKDAARTELEHLSKLGDGYAQQAAVKELLDRL